MYELKRLAQKNLDGAVALAKHYRDLNQPEEAESICRDVLDVAPENEDALRTLGLALTDRFPAGYMTLFDEAIKAFEKLSTEYDRLYYTGIAWERYAKAQLAAGRGHNALHAFEEAIEQFEAAEKVGRPDDAAPVLHYNHCVRALLTHPELVRVSQVPHKPEFEFGD